MNAKLALAILISTAWVTQGCSTASRRVASEDGTRSPYEEGLAAAGLHSYFANLHAHHYMKSAQKKAKQKASNDDDGDDEEGSSADAGCPVSGPFPEDDGRPCRDGSDGKNHLVEADAPENAIPYFRAACEYAREQGGLDILFVTPHTKDGRPSDASTSAQNLRARHALLKEINAPYQGRFYCGLGQEASSISAGNHINILGQFPNAAEKIDPLFFKAGAFDELYPQLKRRNAAGERILLQLNHPNVRGDLWWRPIQEASKKKKKELLNDYGLDDYAPVSCLLRSGKGVCDTLPEILTQDMLQETYAHIREASGDPFRQIEIVSPGGAPENSGVVFRSVQSRKSADEPARGMQDFIYYLQMGFKLSPTANQDNHQMNWGSSIASRTGILAASLDEKDIIDALDQRRTFATEDKNARIWVTAATPGNGPQMMGSSISTDSDSVELAIGYQDPDAQDKDAVLRVYFYRDSDALDFGYQADVRSLLRTVEFKPNGEALLPSGAGTTERADTLPISNGQVVRVKLPVLPGHQYAFVEVTQSQDFDKIWSAPVWIDRH